MRICLDLDGVIAQLKSSGQDYSECLPVPGAIEKIRDLKNNGHYIIIYTARHMKTCNANPGLTIARIGKITLEWLEKHNIEYISSIPFDKFDKDKNIFNCKNKNHKFLKLKEISLIFSLSQINEGGFFVIIGKKLI